MAAISVSEASLETRHNCVCSLACFSTIKGPPPGQNHFVYLADAFLHGKLGVSGGGTVLAEIVPFNGNYYVVYPPMPAVLLLPFVALFGTSFDQGLMSVFLACLAVAATWFMLKKLKLMETRRCG